MVTWRRRYAEAGLAGLEDLPRPGSPSPLPEGLRDRVLELTLTEPPIQYGATHWSSRLLAAALGAEGTPISHATIARIWHRFGVQPWRAQTFTFSTDPALEAKIRDVVGLYLHPPEKAVVRRGNFPTVADLIAAIHRFIDAWNDRCAPFTWIKDPDTVIAKATDPRKDKTKAMSVTQH